MTINRTGNSKVIGKKRHYEVVCSICGHIKLVQSSLKPKRCSNCFNESSSLVRRIYNRIKVKDSGCYEWLGYFTKDNYAVVKFQGKKYRVIRVLLENTLGKPISADKEACHTCNNSFCVNPNHLYEGTHAENGQDLSRSNKNKGIRNAACKIDEKTAKDIKNLLSSDLTNKRISELLDINKSIIENIKYRRSWTWL